MDKVKLLNLCKVSTGKYDANHACNNGKYKFFTCADNSSYCNTYSFSGPCIILPGNGANVGNVYYYDGKFDAYQRTYVLYDIKCNSMYLFRYLKYFWNIRNKNLQYGSATNYIKMGNFENFIVDLPNSETQQKIVDELDCLSDIIEKKKQQLADLDNLIKSQFIEMFGDVILNPMSWEQKPILEVTSIKGFNGKIEKINDKVWLLNLDMIESQSGQILSKVYVDEKQVSNSTTAFNENYVLYSKLRPYLNKVALPNTSGYCTTELIPLLPNKDLLNKYFLCEALRSESFVKFIQEKVAGAKMPRVQPKIFKQFKLIIPPIELQNKFADFVKHIDKLKFELKQSIEETQNLFSERMQHYFGD